MKILLFVLIALFFVLLCITALVLFGAIALSKAWSVILREGGRDAG